MLITRKANEHMQILRERENMVILSVGDDVPMEDQ